MTRLSLEKAWARIEEGRRICGSCLHAYESLEDALKGSNPTVALSTLMTTRVFCRKEKLWVPALELACYRWQSYEGPPITVTYS